MSYCIKDGYIEHAQYLPTSQSKGTDQFQNDVYQLARELAVKHNYKHILDIGCGSGNKLMKFFKEFETLGLEVESNLVSVQRAYPERNWQLSNFFIPLNKKVDLVICADVIEHLLDPDLLLNFIKKIEFVLLVLSTPARERVYRCNQNGPPRNKYHIREWTIEEFNRYVGQHFTIIEHKPIEANGQVLVGKLKL